MSLPNRIRALTRGWRKGDACVLAYHSIGTSDTPLTVHPEAFAAQMEWVRTNAHPISAADLGAYCAGASLPERSMLVTFDDGYRDNLTTAWPELKRAGIPALIFVSTGFVGANFPLYAEMIPALSWREITDWAADDLVEFGAHSTTHVRLPEVPLDIARRSIVESKGRLE
jgi:peptidoglycan/xylan/chitin deacetylase (PgdA/CDA1 family)